MHRSLSLARLWILTSAYFSAAGLLLSRLGALHQTGYACAGVVFVLLLGVWMRFGGGLPPVVAGKWRWRLRHGLPLIFVALTALSLAGGALYAPNNYDALTYRLPRVLHWLADHHWHWIATREDRLNLSATGFEWLMAPLMAWTGGDRLLFLINIASYVLMPGLVFAMLVELGVARRVAWWWMWLLPSGYCYALQAGSIGNDGFAAVYLLAAIAFPLRARRSGAVADLWYGMLAAALLVGAKTSNLPLLLPCALAMLPAFPLLMRRTVGTLAVTGCCVLVSCLPLIQQNWKETGDWTGDPHNARLLQIKNPVAGVIGNTLMTVTRNAMPPVMPLAKVWNTSMDRLLGTPERPASPAMQALKRGYPRINFAWSELEQEEGAGLGLGISALWLVTLGAACFACGSGAFRWEGTLGGWICLASWISVLAYMAKMGSESVPRLLAPYYPLLLAGGLLCPAVRPLLQRKWWRCLAVVAALSAVPALVLTPSHPLWPALTVLEKAAASHPGNRMLERAATVYAVYRDRNEALAPLCRYLPKGESRVGLLSDDDPQVALWRPFGTRQVMDWAALPGNGMETGTPRVVVASEDAVQSHCHTSVEEWVASNHGRIVGEERLLTKVSRGPQRWVVVMMEP